jgi:hypothetical protein
MRGNPRFASEARQEDAGATGATRNPAETGSAEGIRSAEKSGDSKRATRMARNSEATRNGSQPGPEDEHLGHPGD